jgi:hypothetical protein
MQQPGGIYHPHSTIEHEFRQVLRIEIIVNLMDEDCTRWAPRAVHAWGHGFGPSVFQPFKAVNLAKLRE